MTTQLLTYGDMQVALILSMPFAENSYVSHLDGRTDCLIFDPGLEPEKIVDWIDSRQLTPAAILNTHGHADHIAGNAAMKERWPEAPLIIGAGDAAMLTDARLNLSAGFGAAITSPPAEQLLNEGDVYKAAGFEFDIHEIPGHSSGHIVFVTRDRAPKIVFGGDVLFSGSVGRVDFPGGSMEKLTEGIHGKLFTLPDDTIVLSGHGEPTLTGIEKRSNPWVGAPAGYTE